MRYGVLVFSLISLILLSIYNPVMFFEALNNIKSTLRTLLPSLILVLALMTLTNKFLTQKRLKKLAESNWLWVFAIVGGIVSMGSIFMWYPFLADLKKKGVSNGVIACFLYNRGIKLALLPIIVVYFGWKFTITLTLLMIVFSLIQGMLINVLVRE